MSSKLMVLDIQRFAEGGAEGTGTGESAAAAQPQNTGGAEQNTADNTPVAGENTGSQPEIDFSSYSEEQIEELIDKNPAFNKVMGKRMKNSFGKRLAQERARMQEDMKPVNDVLDKLMVHHNAKNMAELTKKVDAAIKEEFSAANGLTSDVGNQLFEYQVNKFREARMLEYQASQEQVDKQLKIWNSEADAVKNVYKDFDLNTELANPEFGKLLRSGVGMEHAYRVIHMDEFIETAKRETAAAYAKSTAQMQARPSENGLGNQAAVNGQKDVSKLTKKERAELAKRAQRGETITF